MDTPSEGTWFALRQEVVEAWAAGQKMEAFLQLGGVAARLAPPHSDDAPDAPPRWLTDDVDHGPFGGPANLGWLLTAFAIIGGELGLRDDQLELALARAKTAAVRAGTSLRQLAAPFEANREVGAISPLAALLLRRVHSSLRVLDASRAEETLSELLAQYPDAVETPSWLSFELAAINAVRARMHDRDELTATAFTNALSAVLDRQPDAVRRGALGLRALRGSLQVWRAEARFGTDRHDEAMAAIEAAAAIYDSLPEVVDLPRSQIPLLRGHHALRIGHPDLATQQFVDAMLYLTEVYHGPSALLGSCIDVLPQAVVAAADPRALDTTITALTRAWRALRRHEQTWAVDARGATTVALAKVLLAQVRANRGTEARAGLPELHAQISDPSLKGIVAVTACSLAGDIHAQLGEHATACGCYDAALGHLGRDRLADLEVFIPLTREYAVSLARSGNLDGLERMIRAEHAIFRRENAEAIRAEQRWIDHIDAAIAVTAFEASSTGDAGKKVADRLLRIGRALDVAGQPVPSSAPTHPDDSSA